MTSNGHTVVVSDAKEPRNVPDPQDFCLAEAGDLTDVQRSLDAWMIHFEALLDKRFQKLETKLAETSKHPQPCATTAQPRRSVEKKPQLSEEKNQKAEEQSPKETPHAVEKQRSTTMGMLAEMSAEKSNRSTSPKTLVQRIVLHPYFGNFISFAVIMNALFMGVRVEYQIVNGGSEMRFTVLGEYLFYCVFLAELIIRILAARLDFLFGKNWEWNVFDLILVVVSTLDLINTLFIGSTTELAASFEKSLRMLRVCRVIRIVRLVRFFAELRVMVGMIIHSLRSLFWMLVLLWSLMYIFAIVFTQGVVDYLYLDNAEVKSNSMVQRHYGSLLLSIYSLFKSMSGGVSWGEMLDPLSELHIFYVILYIIYIFLAIFSVMNIVTGVFVDSAIQHGQDERDILIQREKRRKALELAELKRLLDDLDRDNSGTITFDEFEARLQDEDIRCHFQALQIDSSETQQLFGLLDVDGDGQITISEFIDGCMRIRGGAKSIDIQKLCAEIQMDNKKLRACIMDFMGTTQERFEILVQAVVGGMDNELIERGKCVHTATIQ